MRLKTHARLSQANEVEILEEVSIGWRKGQSRLLFDAIQVRLRFAEDGTADDRITRSRDRFLDEFLWYAEALKPAKAAGTPY